MGDSTLKTDQYYFLFPFDFQKNLDLISCGFLDLDVPMPITNKKRATENRNNYLRARDASRSRSTVRKNGTKNVFDAVLKSTEAQKGQVFVLDASGETGKTHTINLIQAAISSKKKIAIATTLSGIAETLLSHGRTLHRRCNVPLQIHETSMCNISPQDATGVLFKKNQISSSLMKSLWDTSMCLNHRTVQCKTFKKIIAIWGPGCTFGWRLATNL